MNYLGFIILIIVSVVFIYYTSLYAYKHRDKAIFIIGVILINVFTFWAFVALFVLFFSSLIFELVKENNLTFSRVISFALVGALKFSAVAVIVALAINLLIQFLGSGVGSCGRGSPQWC